jgi:hypothetical protein
MNVSEYIKLPREERTVHIDLSTPCVVDESVGVLTRKRRGREALAKKLGLKYDSQTWLSAKVHCAHLCEHHSVNGWCENPEHIYLATALENHHDKPVEIRKNSAQIAGNAAVKKQKGVHDPQNKERVKEGNSRGGKTGAGGRKGCRVTNAKRRMCTVTGFISTPGPLARYQKSRGISNHLFIDLDD